MLLMCKFSDFFCKIECTRDVSKQKSLKYTTKANKVLNLQFQKREHHISNNLFNESVN